MKVMVIGKASKDTEAGVMAPEEKWEEMGRFNEELIKAGILVAAYGLHPSSRGVRIHVSGGDHLVKDGPFAETNELIAGFSIWEVPSMAEAVAWVKRCPNPTAGDWHVEIRQIISPEDIGQSVSPEIQQQVEDRWAKVASRDKK
jgi:hypothetical protein